MALKDKLESINVILKPLALLVEIIGFSLIVWQVFIARQAFEVQAWQMITQQMTEIDKIFVEHPDLYPYFYQKKQIDINDPLYPKVVSMADMLLDYMDGFEDDFVRKLAGMEDNGKYWKAWEKYFQDQFNLSPVLCNRYKEVKSWYTENGVLDSFAIKGCRENK